MRVFYRKILYQMFTSYLRTLRSRSTFLLPFCLLALTGYAQRPNPWLRTSPVKIGAGVRHWTFNEVYNNFRYSQIDNVDGNSLPLDLSENNSVTYSNFPLVLEHIGKNFHFSCNSTGSHNLLIDLWSGYKTVGDDDTEARRLELIPTELGFGGWIKDRVGLFAGAQYAYSRVSITDDDVPDEYIVGGNQRGFHTVAFFNLNRVLLKSTFMYDWVRQSSRAGKGNAQTVDLEGYLALGQSRIWGIWGSVSFQRIYNTGPSGTPTDDWNNDGIQNVGGESFSYRFPDVTSTAWYVRGGFYLMFWQLRTYDWQEDRS